MEQEREKNEAELGLERAAKHERLSGVSGQDETAGLRTEQNAGLYGRQWRSGRSALRTSEQQCFFLHSIVELF